MAKETDDMYEGYAAQDFETEEWWLAAPEHLLVWARLRVLSSGVAHVFDSPHTYTTSRSKPRPKPQCGTVP